MSVSTISGEVGEVGLTATHGWAVDHGSDGDLLDEFLAVGGSKLTGQVVVCNETHLGAAVVAFGDPENLFDCCL
jgi:hypothetical protein